MQEIRGIIRKLPASVYRGYRTASKRCASTGRDDKLFPSGAPREVLVAIMHFAGDTPEKDGWNKTDSADAVKLFTLP